MRGSFLHVVLWFNIIFKSHTTVPPPTSTTRFITTASDSPSNMPTGFVRSEVPLASPCRQIYKETYLPANTSLEIAQYNMHPVYPLVNTHCSFGLLPLLCSVHLPKYNGTSRSRLLPCQHFCTRVEDNCRYAATQLDFPWPEELSCSKFPSSGECFDFYERNETRPLGNFMLENQTSCQAMKPNPFCGFVAPRIGLLFSHTKLTSDEQDRAIFGMSTFVPLFHALQSAGEHDCVRQLSFFLCTSRFRVCFPRGETPRLQEVPPSRKFCSSFFNSSSQCSLSHIKDILKMNHYNISVPELNVNCSKLPVFGLEYPNSGLLGPVITNEWNISRLNKISISKPIPGQLHIKWVGNVKDTRTIQGYGILWRKHPGNKAYNHIHSKVESITLRNLQNNTLYDILITTLRTNGSPGPFVKITASTSEVKGFCPKEAVGTDEASGVFIWPQITVGSLASIACPYDNNTTVTRQCQYENNTSRTIKWGVFDSSDCKYRNRRSQKIFLLSQKRLNPGNVVAACVEIRNISTPGVSLTAGDIINIAAILEHIVGIKEKINEVADNFLDTVDNVLDARLHAILEGQQKSNSSLRIVQALNTLLETLNITERKSFQRILRNFAVDVSIVDPRTFPGVTFSGIIKSPTGELTGQNIVKEPSDRRIVTSPNSTTIRLPRSLFKDSTLMNFSQPQTIILALYRETKFFRVLTAEESAQPSKRLNSFVIAGSIEALPISRLKRPVVLTYADLRRGDKNGALCSFWNFSEGNWSQEGCSFRGILKDGRILCHCDHLTNFAILMDIHLDEETSHVRVLGLISYIGCALSLVGLVLTILTVVLFKDLRTKVPSQILLNFCIALSLTLIVFLAAAERSKTSSLAACRAAAIALHYFVLVTFMWMAIEAFNMYMAFVKVIPSYFPKFMLKCWIAAWGFPVVIVAITKGIAIDYYGDDKYCRLQGIPFLVSFLTPVLIILLGNSIAFVLIFRSLLTSGSKVTSDRKVTGLQQARQGVAIMVLLGLTWLFGVLAVRDAKLAFQYLFCIFNSLQGLLVFIFYCILPAATRKQYKKFIKKKTRRLNRKDEVPDMQAYTRKNNYIDGSSLETNTRKRNSESVALVNIPENIRKPSTFESPVIEMNEICKETNAEEIESPKIGFVAKEEIVLRFQGQTRYVSKVTIMVNNNAKD